MSHAGGKVKFKDNTIMHFEYNGTSDVVIPKMYHTKEEVIANWRNHEYDDMYKCAHIEEDVEIAHTYGHGSTMSGRACRKCNCITFDYENYLERLDALEWMGWYGDCNISEEIGWAKSGLPDWYYNND